MAGGWRAPALVAVGWVVLGVAAGALEAVALGDGSGWRMRPGLPLAGVLWVPLAFAAAGLSRKVPWDPERRVRFVLVHGFAAACTTFVLNGAFFAVAALAGWEPLELVVPGTLRGGLRWMHVNAAAWIGMVAVYHVADGRIGPTGPSDASPAAPAAEPMLHVPRGQGGLQVPLSEIDWLQADGDYVQVHTGGRSYLVSKRMKEIESELADPRFLRVHRSAIVNVARVREVRHRSHGDFEALLADGTVVRVSRTRRDALLAAIGPGEPA